MIRPLSSLRGTPGVLDSYQRETQHPLVNETQNALPSQRSVWAHQEARQPVAGDGQDSGHGVIFRVGSGVVFDLVSQDEVGAGVAGSCGGEVLTQFRNGGGGATGG